MRASRASSTSAGEMARELSCLRRSAMESEVRSMLFDHLRHDEEAIGGAGCIGQSGLGAEAGARVVRPEDVVNGIGMRRRFHAGNIDLLELFDVIEHLP